MMSKVLFRGIVTSPSSIFRSAIPIARSSSSSSSWVSSHSHGGGGGGGESKNVRVLVWWDFENCHIPAGVNVLKVAQIITSAVRANGIKGPVQITAFGDVLQLSTANQLALSMTGVNINHIPRGGKNSADRSLLVDLMYWVSQNPPPAHLFLISGDSDFASVLHRLRMNNYNILLACTNTAPSVLRSAASIMWQWPGLINEEKLVGKHFNQPPDGPHGSWYGHYRLPLENPFSVEVLQQVEPAETCDQVSELNIRSVSKGRSIPPAVLKQISHILSLHPRGIPITDFRDQLMKSNVKIQNDFYGYKKFTQFLLSMPDIVELNNAGHGMYIVHGVNNKSRLSVQANGASSSSEVINNQEAENIALFENKSEKMKSSLSSSAEVNDKHHPVKMQPSPSIVNEDVKEECPNKVKQHHSVAEEPDAGGAMVDDGEVNRAKEHASGSNSGIIRTIWKSLLAGDRSQIENASSSETLLPSRNGNDLAEKGETTLEDHRLSSKTDVREKNDTDAKNVCSQDESFAESAMVNKMDKSPEACVVKGPGLLSRINNWFRSWSNPSPKILVEQPEKDLEQQQQQPAFFTKDSFWNDVEDFILTPEGSDIISQSTTREQIALKLQKQGPSTVRSLNEEAALMLVHLLISEKRWVEESSSASSPFKLVRAMDNSSGDPRATYNRLSSIFSCLGSESKRKPSERINNVYGADMTLPLSDELHALKPGADSELSDSSRKDEESDSLWEELGPVSDASAGRCRVPEEAKNRYEPPAPDDYFSDSDWGSGKSRCSNSCYSPINQKKPKPKEEESSLFQILDSWYGHHQECDNTALSSSGKVTIPAKGMPRSGTEAETSSHDRHSRPQKRFSFVADPVVDNKDQLINRILCNLKKSSDSTMRD